MDKTIFQVLKDQISSLRELIFRVEAGDEVNHEDLSTKIEKLQMSLMKLSHQFYKYGDNPARIKKKVINKKVLFIMPQVLLTVTIKYLRRIFITLLFHFSGVLCW